MHVCPAERDMDGHCQKCGAEYHSTVECGIPLSTKAWNDRMEERLESAARRIMEAKMSYTIKDSGERVQFGSGMVRDTDAGKVDYALALDGPMFQRYAEHLTKGALKYEKRNWMKADDAAALERFRASALRHFLQWFRGDMDEDHAAAVIFNLNGAEYVRGRLSSEGGEGDK